MAPESTITARFHIGISRTMSTKTKVVVFDGRERIVSLIFISVIN